MDIKIYIYFAIITVLNIMETDSYFRRGNDMYDEYFARKIFPKGSRVAVGQADPCTPNPCKNQATCMPHKDKPKCFCEKNYYGDLCEGKCACKNGFCKRNEEGKFVCKCPPEWGQFTTKLCKKCNCGKDANCTFEGDLWKTTKYCICKDGYKDINGFCKAKDCNNTCGTSDGTKCEKRGTDIVCGCQDDKKIFYLSAKECKRKECADECGMSAGVNCDDTGTDVVCTCEDDKIFYPSAKECKSKICADTCGVSYGAMCDDTGTEVVCGCAYDYLFNPLTKKCEDCKCQNGKCEYKQDSWVCVCNPEYGRYEKGVCKACYCGKGANCTFDPGVLYDGKICICPEGFVEYNKRCVDAKEYNPCRWSTCSNGGTCTKAGLHPVCICPPAYYGEWCQLGFCSPNPCRSDGVCFVVNGTVNCLCKNGFTGNRCERNLCSPNPCRNRGTCKVIDDNVICFCQEQFTGEKCETNLCDPNPCKNGGECGMQNGRLRCFCNDLFTGKRCETDRCIPNPCENSGTCAVVNGNTTCFCRDSFAGDYCERDVSEWDRLSTSVVLTTPGNSSSVSDYVTSTYEEFNTTVSKTFVIATTTSKRDENRTTTGAPTVIPDLCSLHHCMNDGICRVVNKKPRCSCFSPFTGEFCEKDPCTENPCRHRGTCLLSGNTFKCICKETFSGGRCESSAANIIHILLLATLSLLIVIITVHVLSLVFRRCRSRSKNAGEYAGLDIILSKDQWT